MNIPPLTQERLTYLWTMLANVGITPACAGQTKWQVCFLGLLKDHPRLRGKDSVQKGGEFLKLGSPPLTRERHACTDSVLDTAGITPAYAGKTILNFPFVCPKGDHPR